MGAVAARLSDLVIVTSDNPRSEDPARIIEEIKRGIVPPADRPAARLGEAGSETRCLTIVDRKAAIERAVRDAEPNDLILIAGKGHEKYQVVGARVLPFDDVDVARTALERRRAGSRVS
jgi:UDP-N-acetylmuramoyl-L-alanyl-D-glutamate--2,6-diaminopimelate ligase